MSDEKPADEAQAPGKQIDFMSVTVTFEYEGDKKYENISAWKVSVGEALSIERNGYVVAYYPPGKWAGMTIATRFTDGSWVDADGQGGAPENVGLGVEVTAIGGRTK